MAGFVVAGLVAFLGLAFIGWRLFLFFVWEKPGSMPAVRIKKREEGPAWYTARIERKDAEDENYYSQGYIRYPVLKALGEAGPDYGESYQENAGKIRKLVADVRESRTGYDDFKGLFYVFWTGKPLEGGTYQSDEVVLEIRELQNTSLVPYLEKDTYCEKDGDCMKRDLVSRCCTGVFNKYEQVRDVVQGCPPGFWFECRGDEREDLGCYNCEVRYDRIKCVDNRCEGVGREIISFE